MVKSGMVMECKEEVMRKGGVWGGRAAVLEGIAGRLLGEGAV